MKTSQKIIKYLALAFAFFIILNIIGGIMIGIREVSHILRITNKVQSEEKYEKLEDVNIEALENSEEIKKIKIELKNSKLQIKKAETFKIATNNEDIEFKRNNNTLQIKEKENNWFKKAEEATLTLYISEDTIFEEVEIEAGAGKITIEQIKCNELDLEIGAGKITIQKLEVYEKTEIKGGAGKVEIEESKMNNLNLDMGVGKFTISTILSGNNEIRAGIGKLELDLKDSKDNYRIKIEKGIGDIEINNKNMEDNSEFGSGPNKINIEGGIGKIDIKVEE